MEDRNENIPYGMNEPYQNNTQYGQQPYGQNTQNTNTPYGQNQAYGTNVPYGQDQQYVQQPYGQPQYNHPIVVRDTMADRNGAGIAGFVIACFAILFCWIPIVDVVLSVVGIVCAAIGLGKDKQSGRGLAVAGLVISIIALLLSLIISFLIFLGMSV